MVMQRSRQEPRRDGGQPRRHRKRRSLPDCDIYMRTGGCALGVTCVFNHPLEPLLQLYQKNMVWFLQHYPAPLQLFQKYMGRFLQHQPALLQAFEKQLDIDKLDFEGLLELEYPERLGQPECQLKEGLAARSAGDIHSPDTGPSCSLDPSTSSSAKYFSAVDVFQSSGCSKLDSSSDLQSVIEDSKVHWSELSSSNDSDGTEESNREIFESFHLLPKYERWLKCDVAPGDISLGPKIAEGGQAEIFEVKFCSKKRGLSGGLGSVLKVFKKGYSLRDLKSQWPDGLLFEGRFSMLFEGCLVLEDDRFALLLSRSDMDLRQLIDVTLDKDSPLFDQYGTPRLRELRAYKPKCARSKCSTPVFGEVCAGAIMYRIALEMKDLHSADILHRDLKASNILCSIVWLRNLSVSVADYESSIGIVGTAFWRAPEILQQLKERKPRIHFTREADVYGFAMTCYEIWTGHIPFEEYMPRDFDHVLNGGRPTLPDHVPSWVQDLIQRCWHQNPSERPSFSAIIKELESRPIFCPLPTPDFTGHHARGLVFLMRASD